MNSLKPLTKKKLPFVRPRLKFEMLQKSDIINNVRSPDKKDRQIMKKKKKSVAVHRSTVDYVTWTNKLVVKVQRSSSQLSSPMLRRV